MKQIEGTYKQLPIEFDHFHNILSFFELGDGLGMCKFSYGAKEMMLDNAQKVSPQYGSMGCEVFKRGVQFEN